MSEAFIMPENTYFHGEAEAREYKFVNVPTILLTDPIFSQISSDSKILYALLLDRMGLSIKNNWRDEEGRVYIYFTIDEVVKSMNVKETKAKLLFKELTNINGSGYSLITKVRQLNRPSRIYVHKFMDVYHLLAAYKQEKNPCISPQDTGTTDRETHVRPTEGRKYDRPRDTGTTDRGTQVQPTVGHDDNRPWDTGTSLNYINNNNTDSVSVIISDLSYPSVLQSIRDGAMDVYQIISPMNDYISSLSQWKSMMKRQEITELFCFDTFSVYCNKNHLTLSQKNSLSTDILRFKFPSYQLRVDQGLVTNVEEAMIGFMSAVLSSGESISINGVNYDNRYLCDSIFSLDDDEYILVVDTIKNTTSQIKDYKKYYMRCILEAHNNFNAETGSYKE